MITHGSMDSSVNILVRHLATILIFIRILAGTIGDQATRGVGMKGAVIMISIIAVTAGVIVATITVMDAGQTVRGVILTLGRLLTTRVAAETLTATRQVAGSQREVPHPLLKRTEWSILPAGEPSLEIIPNDRAVQERQTMFKLVELNTEVT